MIENTTQPQNDREQAECGLRTGMGFLSLKKINKPKVRNI